MTRYFICAIMALFGAEAFGAGQFGEELTGTWRSGCIQTQINGKSGYVTETYTFKKEGAFAFLRTWFKGETCAGEPFSKDSHHGTIALGGMEENNGFNPSGTKEATFLVNGENKEKGLIWISKSSDKMRVARGFGSGQNTMLGLTVYTK